MKHIERIGSVGVIVFSLAQSAFAQTVEDRAGARAAAEQGVKAYAQGRWAEAADLMGRAEKIVHAPTHLLYLAQAEEKLGHLVVAHEIYLRIVREQLGRDAPSAFVAAQAEAKERSEALRARLSQVSIVIQGVPTGAKAKVSVDGAPLPAALVGVPYPIDPGEHQFEATAEGLSSGLVKSVLHEGSSDKIVLTLKDTSAAATPAGATPTASTQPAAAAVPTPTAPTNGPPVTSARASGMHPLKLGGYIGLGVGVLGVGVGTIFALRSSGLRNDADALCNGPNGQCPTSSQPQIADADSKANSAGTLAVVGFVTGGVGLAAGVTMLLLAPSREQLNRAAYLVPYVGANSAGVWGRF